MSQYYFYYVHRSAKMKTYFNFPYLYLFTEFHKDIILKVDRYLLLLRKHHYFYSVLNQSIEAIANNTHISVQIDI